MGKGVSARTIVAREHCWPPQRDAAPFPTKPATTTCKESSHREQSLHELHLYFSDTTRVLRPTQAIRPMTGQTLFLVGLQRLSINPRKKLKKLKFWVVDTALFCELVFCGTWSVKFPSESDPVTSAPVIDPSFPPQPKSHK